MITWPIRSPRFGRTWADWTLVRIPRVNAGPLSDSVVFANAGIVEKVDYYKREESDSRGLPPKLNTTVVDINLTAVVNTAYLAIHFFRKNDTPGGALVVTASTGGLYPTPYLPMYSAAKHGCVGLTRSIAGPLSKEAIRVNCICPGAVRTGLISQQEWDRFPQGTFVPIDNVVKVVQMLVNDQTLQGKAVELIQDKWKFRDPPVFEDEAMKEVMTMSGDVFEPQKR